MEEVWKDISGYENIYQVSNKGRVKSLARKTNQSDKKRYTKEKILKQRKTTHGYMEVTLRKNNIRKHYKVHRLVMMAFHGKSKLIVNHIDCNKTNNNVENLEYCTYQENSNHYLWNRKQPKIDTYKKEIINLYAKGYSIKYLSRTYKYDPKTVKHLLSRNDIKIRKDQREIKMEVAK